MTTNTRPSTDPPTPDAPARPSTGAVIAGLAAVVGALGAVAVVGVLHRMDATGPGSGSGVAAVAVALVATLVMVMVSGVRRAGPWVAAAGVGSVLAGSGVLRWGDQEIVVPGGGDVVATARVLWPLVALGLALVAAGTVLAVMRPGGRPSRARAAVVGLAAEAVGLAVLAATMGDVIVGEWVEGRPRRRRGRLVVAPAGDATAGSIGAVWAGAARDEAAAVDAFTDLARRLAEVGAPAALVERSRSAAADEVRHARQCRRLAARHGHAPPGSGSGCGRPGDHIRSPNGASDRPRPPRLVEIVRLAVESYVDGVVGEGMAAGRMERGAGTAPHLASTLTAIAGDERAHAGLGADVVRWCVAQAPRTVPLAVRSAARRLPTATVLPRPHAAHPDDDLRAAGLVDRAGADAVWRTERARALATLGTVLRPARSPDQI